MYNFLLKHIRNIKEAVNRKERKVNISPEIPVLNLFLYVFFIGGKKL